MAKAKKDKLVAAIALLLGALMGGLGVEATKETKPKCCDKCVDLKCPKECCPQKK